VNHNDSEEFLGVDVGDVRVGLARGSSLSRIAEPLATIPAKTSLDIIKNAAKDNSSMGIVVGLPRSLEGKNTAQTKKVRQWVKQAKSEINLPFYWQDEALTTKTAETGSSKSGTDALAASIILQDFLDTPKDERVRC